MTSPQHQITVPSVENVVYETLRDFIVGGEYLPGHRLHLAELATQFGVSTMPVRGALARLTNEGLVRQLPRRGATVAPLDLAEYLELQDLRIGIETMAARYGVEHLDDARLAEMKRILGELWEETEVESIIALEWDAYIALYGAPGRRRTVDLVQEYGRLAERYTRFMYGFDFKQTRAAKRLAQVVEACERGDGDAVAELIASHMSEDARRVAGALEVRIEEEQR
ncbi:MAG: GntR family transcriptional regulator [Microbacterium sp.]|uniref:GntR family transcriptional regulator n=1 Tax=Microbacterium sp. TaxID=51671 RepID=UPI0039E682FF